MSSVCKQICSLEITSSLKYIYFLFLVCYFMFKLLTQYIIVFPYSDLPLCESRTVTYFIYSQPINVTCTYSAHPRVTEIRWHWNSSNDVNSSRPVERLQQIQTTPQKGPEDSSSAQLTVYPSMEAEDRELTCRGINELGNQTKSCKFFIKRASKWIIYHLFSIQIIRVSSSFRIMIFVTFAAIIYDLISTKILTR